jgi:hypothetical protein
MLEKLEEMRRQAEQGGGAKRIQAQHERGTLTIRSRRGLDSQMGQRSGVGSTDITTINTLCP